MKETEMVDVFDHGKALALIPAILDSAEKLGCNLLETAHACKCVRAVCLVEMGGNARKILEAKEGEVDEMLVVQKEDALD